MHDTAYKTGKSFFELYWKPDFHNIVDFGSSDVNGSLRDHCPPGAEYTGLDLEAGPGVDFCIRPHERLPLCDEFADIVVASSVFEHDELFWETFLELVRITRRGGFLYISAPSNGHFHRHPVDCWRFYPDASTALVKWAHSKGLDIELVESCILRRGADGEQDRRALGPALGQRQIERIPAALGLPLGNDHEERHRDARDRKQDVKAQRQRHLRARRQQVRHRRTSKVVTALQAQQAVITAQVITAVQPSQVVTTVRAGPW